MELREMVKEIRKEAPTMGVAPAVQLARWRMTTPELPFTTWDDSWKHEVQRDGFTVRVVVDYDYDYNATEWLGDYTDDAEDAERNPEAWYLRDKWCSSYRQDNRGTIMVQIRDKYGYFKFAPGFRRQDHYEWAHTNGGMSRSVAHDYAASMVARDLARLEGNGPTFVYVKATAYRSGIKLGEASLWGIELADRPDKWGDNARYLSEMALEQIHEAVSEARGALGRLCEVNA